MRKKILLILFIVSNAQSLLAQWSAIADSAVYFMNEEQDYEKAIRYLNRSINILKKDSANTVSYAKVSNSLGSAYYYNGEYKKSLNAYLVAKEIREKKLGKEHADYLNTCNNLAALYNEMGYYDKAEPLIIETKNTREKIFGKEHIAYAGSCNSLGTFYFETGRLEKALPLFLETQNILSKKLGKQHPNYISTLSNIATVYGDMGRYAEAEALYLEAIENEKMARGKETILYATTINNLAVFYVDLGQHQKAEELYLETKNIREKLLGNNHPDYADICGNLAALYDIMDKDGLAEPLYIESRNTIEKVFGKEHPAFVVSTTNLGTFYLENKDYKKALPLFLESKKVVEELFGKENAEYATTCNNLALLYNDIGETDKSEALYKETLEIREKILGKEHPMYAQTVISLANFYWIQNKLSRADELFQLAFNINASHLKKIFEFTNENEKQQFIKNQAGTGNAFHSFYFSNKEKIKPGESYNISLFNRGLLLSSTTQLKEAIFKSNSTAALNKYNKWITLKNELAFWYAKPKEESPAYLKQLEDSTHQLEKDLTRLSSDFKNAKSIDITYQKILPHLKENEASIEFIEFDFYDGNRWTDSTFYAALILRKNNPEPQMVLLFEKNQLVKLFASTGNRINNDNARILYTSRSEIKGKNDVVIEKSVYDLVWQPLEPYLNGITKIYFAPSGLLHRISFAALPVNNKQVLSDKYILSQLNSTASITTKKDFSLSTKDKVLLFGGIEYNADSVALKNSVAKYAVSKQKSRALTTESSRGGVWQYLEGTRVEIDGIKSAAINFNIHTLSGINATEEAIKSLDGITSPAVLHIATHGFFFPDPKDKKNNPFLNLETSGKTFKNSGNPLLRSGLLFAGANNTWQNKPVNGIEDGILTSYEVANLYLPNTKLVVLSACETALGDIQGSEGVFGLQRAFKIAGVEHLIMSLWKVPDEETAEMMQLFYKNLFNKQTIEDAFYNAQKWMKNKYRNEPYKWAAWILVQ